MSVAYVRKSKDGNYHTGHDRSSGYEMWDKDINKATIYVGWEPPTFGDVLVRVKVVELEQN